MKTELFDYLLPFERIAQYPLQKRDASRMLVLDRKTGRVEHSHVRDLPQWLLPGDLMIVNRTKVIPARLHALKPETGAKIEIFLLRPALGAGQASTELPHEWEALVSPAKRIKTPCVLRLEGKGEAAVLESIGEGHFIVRLNHVGNLRRFLAAHGHVPLPPYIKRADETGDRSRYQTVFAREEGSVAAPTAGLHFTQALLRSLADRGVRKSPVTLHVGLGTFLGITADEVEDHVMHPEWFEVPAATVREIQRAKARPGRVVAVGTTSVRALESAAQADGSFRTEPDETRLFITPGYRFRTVDVLFTNFHQPKSTLLMLVSAFAGRERVLAAYQEAIREGYRFLSYGDAMLIL
ncbi:MAG TPA: tRNA preQ1(34) S-adenosylmethionine ribosyltransferase-isomerase QueA [bacterium]|nr:tRNA preQ1(34) S-adenosylmethionine ribosyltransferase-isomerase QueA [bacterium]